MDIADAQDLANAMDRLSAPVLVVDALLGSGSKGPLRGVFSDAVDAMNALDGPPRCSVSMCLPVWTWTAEESMARRCARIKPLR